MSPRSFANQAWQVAVAGRRETLLVQLESEHENIVCHKQIDVNQNDAPQLLEELIALARRNGFVFPQFRNRLAEH